MAKNKRPKFLEAETPELLNLLKEVLSAEEVDDKAVNKALKVVDELISRQPGTENQPSVDETLKAAADLMSQALNDIKKAYDHEISLIEDSEDIPEEEDEEEEEEAPAPKSNKKGGKKDKSSKKAPVVEEEEETEEEADEDEDDEEEEDYSDWSIKELKKECRSRGIKVTKSTTKADMVKALEADDKE